MTKTRVTNYNHTFPYLQMLENVLQILGVNVDESSYGESLSECTSKQWSTLQVYTSEYIIQIIHLFIVFVAEEFVWIIIIFDWSSFCWHNHLMNIKRVHISDGKCWREYDWQNETTQTIYFDTISKYLLLHSNITKYPDQSNKMFIYRPIIPFNITDIPWKSYYFSFKFSYFCWYDLSLPVPLSLAGSFSAYNYKEIDG